MGALADLFLKILNETHNFIFFLRESNSLTKKLDLTFFHFFSRDLAGKKLPG